MKQEIEINWIRHGKTAWNQEHRYLGKTDVPLCQAGREELLQLKEGLQKKGLQKKDGVSPLLLFSSPMKRCIQTTELLFDKEPVLLPEWEEMDFGSFEGKNYEELSADKEYQRWIDSNGTLPFPQGESREDFIVRSMKGFYKMLALIEQELKENPAPKQIAAVVHGGTIMAVFSELTGQEYFSFQVKNGQGYRMKLQIGEGKCNIISWQ